MKKEIFVAVTLTLTEESTLTSEQVRTELKHQLEQNMGVFGIKKVHLSKGLDLEVPE